MIFHVAAAAAASALPPQVRGCRRKCAAAAAPQFAGAAVAELCFDRWLIHAEFVFGITSFKNCNKAAAAGCSAAASF